MMKLTREDWHAKLRNAATILEVNADMLSKLDAETGDGDHGVTIARMAQIMEHALEQWQPDTTIADFFSVLSLALMNANGGSAGPLWGTLFGGMAEGAGDGDTDEAALKNMFRSGLVAMDDVTAAKVGQKTMMDALIPACEAAQACAGDTRAILAAAAEAARLGAEQTTAYVARYGRAKNLKERAIGHKDPGAVSLSLLFEGFV